MLRAHLCALFSLLFPSSNIFLSYAATVRMMKKARPLLPRKVLPSAKETQ